MPRRPDGSYDFGDFDTANPQYKLRNSIANDAIRAGRTNPHPGFESVGVRPNYTPKPASYAPPASPAFRVSGRPPVTGYRAATPGPAHGTGYVAAEGSGFGRVCFLAAAAFAAWVLFFGGWPTAARFGREISAAASHQARAAWQRLPLVGQTAPAPAHPARHPARPS